MNNHLGNYLRNRREQCGLRRSELARRLGYDNLNKGSRRVHDLEEGRWISREFLLRLIGILEIEPQAVQDLITRDREEYVEKWNRWADEPTPMTAAIRLIPGFIAGIDLPDTVTTPEQALAWAVETAKQRQKTVIVVVSRRESWTIGPDGRADGPFYATPDDHAMPWMALGKTPFLPTLDHGRSANTESEDTP